MSEPELHESTSPQAIALAQTRAIAAALRTLGRGTTDQISAACDLPKSVVTRRLMNSQSPRGITNGWQPLFQCVAGVWQLTAAGQRVAQS